MSVTRADLITRLASSAAISIKDAEPVLSTVLESIGDGLAQGQRIELRGFGVFQRREQNTRQARNPRTGEEVMVPAKATAHFKAGTAMHKLLNGDPDARAMLQSKRECQLRRRDQKAGQLSLF